MIYKTLVTWLSKRLSLFHIQVNQYNWGEQAGIFHLLVESCSVPFLIYPFADFLKNWDIILIEREFDVQ